MLKNIIIINDYAFINGGAGKVAITSACSLALKGYNVTLLCAVGPIDDCLIKSGVHVVCLEQKDILLNPNRLQASFQGIWNRKAAFVLKELLFDCNPSETIIHFHGWTKALSASLFSVLSKTSFKVIITLHDFFCFCPNGGFYDYKKKSICHLKPLSFKCITTNCDARSYPQKIWRVIRQFVQNKALWSNHNLAFVSISGLTQRICSPLILDGIKIYQLADPVEIKCQQPVDIAKNSTYICMSRLSPEKGIDMFCQAMTNLGLNGIVLGDGYLREELERKYPNVKFAGWVSGKEKELNFQKAKCFVFTSLWYETFGLVVAEAKSYGIPCIVPDECAASEMVENGKNGLVFKIGNQKSLESALMEFEKADVEVMQHKVIDSFNPQIFSSEYHINNLIEIFEKVLKKNGE